MCNNGGMKRRMVAVNMWVWVMTKSVDTIHGEG
jgi:hypothetical protein